MSEEPKAPVTEEKEEIDPALLEKALEDFRALIKGNGLKPDSLKLKGFEGEVINFEAYGIFKIEASINEKRVAGRERGEQSGSQTDAKQKINTMIETITLDREVKKLTVNLLEKRQDLGFGINNQLIKLERLNKKFVIHEPCPSCDASGKIVCKNCRGKKLITCVKCQGQRDIQCHNCHGAQFINSPQGERQQCTYCHGRGQISCELCRQSGEVSCPKCKATGRMVCHDCSSTGWHSHVFNVSLQAKGKFDFDRENLPEEVPALIDEYGPKMLTEKHAQIRIIEDSRKDEEMDMRSEADEYIVPYHVKLPWGDIGFSVKDKAIKGKLFGFNALLIDIPPLLEKIIGKSLRLLDQAAQGQGNVAVHIGNAIRARAIGETFLSTLSNPPPKALIIMQERYPYGIKETTLKKMITNAGAALKHLTKKPRQKGLGFGIAIAALFYMAYFMGPLRSLIIGKITTTLPDIIPDSGAIIISGVIVTAAIQINVSNALKRALDKLPSKSSKTKIAPKLQQSALWGFPAAMALFILILVLTITTGTEVPAWYRQISG